MHHLTPEELGSFREDYRDQERAVQKYISVYLSALVVATGWMIGPQSKPMIEMILGNYGMNVFPFLAIICINVIFSCFLTYKSIIIHETMQFVTNFSPRDSAFNCWENWRRGPLSLTKRVKHGYTTTIACLPLFVSGILMWVAAHYLWGDPRHFAVTLDAMRTAILLTAIHVDPTVLGRTLIYGRYAFCLVALFHLMPIRLFYVNVVPTNKQWKQLLNRQLDTASDQADPAAAPQQINNPEGAPS